MHVFGGIPTGLASCTVLHCQGFVCRCSIERVVELNHSLCTTGATCAPSSILQGPFGCMRVLFSIFQASLAAGCCHITQTSAHLMHSSAGSNSSSEGLACPSQLCTSMHHAHLPLDTDLCCQFWIVGIVAALIMLT